MIVDKNGDIEEQAIDQVYGTLGTCGVVNDMTIGGFMKVTFFYEDGSFYKIDLPWGNELIPYADGKISSISKQEK